MQGIEPFRPPSLAGHPPKWLQAERCRLCTHWFKLDDRYEESYVRRTAHGMNATHAILRHGRRSAVMPSERSGNTGEKFNDSRNKQQIQLVMNGAFFGGWPTSKFTGTVRAQEE